MIRARVKHNGKERYLGRFATAAEADRAQAEYWRQRGVTDPRSHAARRGWETRRMTGVA